MVDRAHSGVITEVGAFVLQPMPLSFHMKANIVSAFIVLLLTVTACTPNISTPVAGPPPTSTVTPAPTATAERRPNRQEAFGPGQLLPYTTQTGDTVYALAAHFNTSVAEVLAANPTLPTTMTLPSGLKLKIPAYYFALSGPDTQIIPDSEFVYGPTSVGFDVAAYIDNQPGFLKSLSAFANKRQRSAAETIQFVAEQYSINPKLFLALMEWQTQALTQTDAPETLQENLFGPIPNVSGFYRQLYWVAEQLTVGYYGWRSGALTKIDFQDGYLLRVDSYQNAATVGLHYLFAQIWPFDQFETLAGRDGFAATYSRLWGEPFATRPMDVIEGNLTQPPLTLPFRPNEQWALTGGPHPAWGENVPWGALDFAPPSGESGCIATQRQSTASASGIVTRSGENTVILDLDGDGYEQTGWVLFYFHLANEGLAPAGSHLQVGEPVGLPSCEGGRATGTHVHVARRYNGEWLPAEGIVPDVLPMTLSDWTAVRGEAPYDGRMWRLGQWVYACTCSTSANLVFWSP